MPKALIAWKLPECGCGRGQTAFSPDPKILGDPEPGPGDLAMSAQTPYCPPHVLCVVRARRAGQGWLEASERASPQPSCPLQGTWGARPVCCPVFPASPGVALVCCHGDDTRHDWEGSHLRRNKNPACPPQTAPPQNTHAPAPGPQALSRMFHEPDGQARGPACEAQPAALVPAPASPQHPTRPRCLFSGGPPQPSQIQVVQCEKRPGFLLCP